MLQRMSLQRKQSKIDSFIVRRPTNPAPPPSAASAVAVAVSSDRPAASDSGNPAPLKRFVLFCLACMQIMNRVLFGVAFAVLIGIAAAAPVTPMAGAQPFDEQLAKQLLKLSSAAYSDDPAACNVTSPTLNVTATFSNVRVTALAGSSDSSVLH